MIKGKTCILNDKPLELMNKEELNAFFIERTGKPYQEPSKEEIEECKKKYGIE